MKLRHALALAVSAFALGLIGVAIAGNGTIDVKDGGGVTRTYSVVTDGSGNFVGRTVICDATAAASCATVSGGVISVSAAQAGTWNIATLTTVTNPVGIKGADGSAITSNSNPFPVSDGGGSITVDNNGTFAVQATVAAAATNIAKAEDVASADGDVGVPAMCARKATPANTSGSDGDWEFVQCSAGRVWASATIDAALPVGTNSIGTVQIGNTPNTVPILASNSDGTNTQKVLAASTSAGLTDKAAVVALSPNPAPVCTGITAVNQTTSTDVKTFTNVGHICTIMLVSATAQNISITEGTGTVCATGAAAIIGGTTASVAVAANGGFAIPSDRVTIKLATSGDHLCLLQSGAGNVSGIVTWQDHA